ncbi:hypothetical protein L2E82_09840 [Cichorium intybus]|uniref:Uncharacterized protein n=1 Tax=Cichorium intybus TaxID=13427 RepID=A0ACB9G927_CICIN|nr:hypothetical protein L2E82_09840 [Cichorium intybus]
MAKIKSIYLPLLALLVSLLLCPTFAHLPIDPNCVPPSDPRKQKPPPPSPQKKDPPIDPNCVPPPIDPNCVPPPIDPNCVPPSDPKKHTPPPPQNSTPPPSPPPPQDPPQPPPQDPNENPPQDSNQNPPQDPNEPPKPTPFHGLFKGHFSAVYAFGDSYTDTGNAQYMGSLQASFSGSLSSPYGSTTFGKTSNRLCDGRLVLDFVTDSLGLPVLPPYQSTTANFTTGVNFAIAGATTLAVDLLSKIVRTAFLLKAKPLGVSTQLDWFKKFQVNHICKGLDSNVCSVKLKTALFWVGDIGINDYSRAVGSPISLRVIAKSSTLIVMELVKTVIRSGAKNIVVQGLPPVGCLPVDVSSTPENQRDKTGCSSLINGAILIHNGILQTKLKILRKLFPDVTIIYADSWKAYFTIISNPTKYQFQETHKTCCGFSGQKSDLNFNLQSICGSSGTSVCQDPSKYINWDGIHPTEAMNYQMTDQFFNQGCCQPPFQELMKKTKAAV